MQDNRTLKIDIVQLRKACDILWEHLRALDIDSVNIPHDYYWSVSRQDVYRLDSKPAALVVGQLTDDWQDVQQILEPDRDAIALDFVKVSAILCAVGEEIVA
jgi:hypothetical protein